MTDQLNCMSQMAASWQWEEELHLNLGYWGQVFAQTWEPQPPRRSQPPQRAERGFAEAVPSLRLWRTPAPCPGIKKSGGKGRPNLWHQVLKEMAEQGRVVNWGKGTPWQRCCCVLNATQPGGKQCRVRHSGCTLKISPKEHHPSIPMNDNAQQKCKSKEWCVPNHCQATSASGVEIVKEGKEGYVKVWILRRLGQILIV